MGTTPIYGFPYPDPSDLVANYPALGQQLAEDIETEIAGIGSGLNLITTQPFTTVSSVNVNDCFSTTYDMYEIKINLSAMSASNPQLQMRLRVSATDATTNYFTRRLLQSSTTVSGSDNVLGTTLWFINQATQARRTFVCATIDAPFLAAQTTLITHSASGSQELFGNYHSDTTSYTGFTLLADTGTITGTVLVYGYAK